MKLSKKIIQTKILKIFAIFFAVVFSVLFLIFVAFYNDSGRKFIIDHVVSYLQNENFSLKIEGANEKLTYVDKITAKFSGNLLEVYKSNFERNGFFSRSRVYVKKIIFQAYDRKSGKTINKKENVAVGKSASNSIKPGSSNSSTANLGGVNSVSAKSDDFEANFRTALSYVKKIKIFIESLDIAEAEISVGDIKRKYENFAYKSDGGRDSFSMKSVSVKTNPSQFNLVLDWSNSGNLTGDFRNIEGFSGNVRMNSLESSEPKYGVEVENSAYKINADGSFADKMNTLIISKGAVQCSGKKLDFYGKVWLSENRADLSTKLSLSNFTDVSKIPTEITKNFQDILTRVIAEKKGNCIKSQIEFKKENRKLGNCNVVLQNKNLSVKSDVSWINFWGNKLKSINVYSKNLKNFVVDATGTDILGDDFKISSEIACGKNVSIQKLVCDLRKGKISLSKPFVLDKRNLDTAFKFDLQSLRFWQKYFKVKGATGDVFFKNGLFGVDAKINQILNENFEMYDGKVSGDLNNLKIDVGSVKAVGNMLKNVMLKKKVTR